MHIVETNIEKLSEILNKEYEQYTDRIYKLENSLNEIRLFTKTIKQQKDISAFINFECEQILKIIEDAGIGNTKSN